MHLEVGQGPLLTTGGTIEATHNLGLYRAILTSNPESFGPIKYKFVLRVMRIDINRPVLYVTAEWNELDQDPEWQALKEEACESLDRLLFDGEDEESVEGEAIAIDEPEAEKLNVEGQHKQAYVLGVFSSRGRENLGASDEWADKAKFERKALIVAKEYLAIK